MIRVTLAKPIIHVFPNSGVVGEVSEFLVIEVPEGGYWYLDVESLKENCLA